MTTEREDYVLGEDITEMARGREGRDTAVISFRLSSVELAALSDLAESQGKTISQVGREAVQEKLTDAAKRSTHGAAVSFPSGDMVYFGDMGSGTYGTAVEPEKIFTAIRY